MKWSQYTCYKIAKENENESQKLNTNFKDFVNILIFTTDTIRMCQELEMKK